MLAVLVPILALHLAAVSPAEIREATRDVLDDPTFQTAIPDASSPPPRPQVRRVSRTTGDISSALLWLLVAVAGGVLVVWIGLQFQRFEQDAPAGDAAVGPDGVDTARGRSDGLDPEALAREGRFDEAIHQLLLRAFAHLRATRGWLPDSLTSREVLRDIPLESRAHTALRALTQAVELSLFGGRRAASADYTRCAEHLTAFVASGLGTADA